jgi:hypothetical protein
MDLIFKAGRELGQAVPNAEKGNNSRALSLVRTAHADIARAATKLQPLLASSKALNELAALPSSGSIFEKFFNTIAFIRDNQLKSFYNKGYQAFCAGHLLGFVEEGLRMHGTRANLAQAKAEITLQLETARAHTSALESQCGITGMCRFESKFNAQISNVNAARSNAALASALPHITDLANQVGNAIK